MLLTITTTLAPATDLGFLLHKHPGRAQSFGVAAGGTAHVFYPEASERRCTAALLLEVDPVRAGSGWLGGHPEKGLITRRYLVHRRELTASALARLAEADDLDPDEIDNAVPDEAAEEAVRAGAVRAEEAVWAEAVRAEPLVVRRREAVLGVLREAGARAQFRDWAARVAAGYGYRVRFVAVGRVAVPEAAGAVEEAVAAGAAEAAGAPTQMAVFEAGLGAGAR